MKSVSVNCTSDALNTLQRVCNNCLHGMCPCRYADRPCGRSDLQCRLSKPSIISGVTINISVAGGGLAQLVTSLVASAKLINAGPG